MSTGLGYREAACSIPSSPSSSFILSVSTRGSVESPEQQQPRLHCTPCPLPPSREELLWRQERLSNGISSSNRNSGDKVGYTPAEAYRPVCNGTRTG